MDLMLNIYRRHTDKCSHAYKGREWLKCQCPLHVDGMLNNERVRESLNTRNLQKATRTVADIEAGQALATKTVAKAIELYLADCGDLAASTRRKYRNALSQLAEFCESEEILMVASVRLEHLDKYRQQRSVSPSTASKELPIIKQFFQFCSDRKWTSENPSQKLKQRKVPESDREPYTKEEVAAIIAACEKIGYHRYEKLRARAMVLVMWATALRISDVATLARDRVQDDQLRLRATKNGKPIFLPLPPVVVEALDNLPNPAGGDGEYFFWSGTSKPTSVTGDLARTIKRVFEISKVSKAKTHRFRHTLATNVLATGGAMQDVADILSISARIAEKHYAKWAPNRQERLNSVFAGMHPAGTLLAQSQPKGCN